MIVTCERCAARYKLDDSKVSGRGAKITCPKCRHVFVIFREGDTGKGSTEPSSPSSGVTLNRQPGSTSIVPGANGAGSPISTLVPGASVFTPPAAGSTRPGRAPPHRDVHSLDFRKVGIASWKVRVKIGLIYDFSDYKTLRKYIQEGRVTSSDLLSHDGKTWTPIGDFPDLEMHFIEVYEAAERLKEREERAAPSGDNPFEDESPTAIVGMTDLAASTLADNLAYETPPNVTGPIPRGSGPTTLGARPSPVGGSRGPATLPPTGGSRGATLPGLTEPAEARGRGKSGRSSGATIPPVPKAETERQGLGLGGGIVLVLALAAGGGWAYLNFFQKPSEAVSNTPPPAPVEVAPPVSEGQDIRDKVREDLQRELESMREADPINVEQEPALIPVRPRDARNPSGSKPLVPVTPSTDPVVSTSPPTAKDQADVGDDAWRRGDYATAATAYREATRLEPASAVYQGKLGRALYKLGDSSGAGAALSKADRGGYAEASKWLGHIARDLGDVAGAIGHYNAYLKSSPSDAADIQREIDKLTGS